MPRVMRMPHNASLINCRASTAHVTSPAMAAEQGMVPNLPETPRCMNIQCHGGRRLIEATHKCQKVPACQ